MSADSSSQSSSSSRQAEVLDPRAWLAAVIESSDDAIITKSLEGIVTTWNKGAERIFGFSEAEMIGQPILKIIPDDRQQEEKMILSRLRKGERVDHFETVRRRKDGVLIQVSVTISPVRDSTGRIVGVSKIARDITTQKQFERDILAAREMAEGAMKMAEQARHAAESANRAKDHFLSILSHELRTPLMPVLAAISFVEKSEELSLPLREQIKMIRRNVETEARLVDDLLDLTRISRGKISLHPEIVDVHVLIRNVVMMFQAEIDAKALAVTLALRAQDFYIWADPGRFQQILLNLMSNAVKFTPQEGSISLRSSNVDGQFQLEISDTGVGIEPDLMPRLFSAFEQGEWTITRRFGGLGLGLSIVKTLIEMHKGSIAVVSAGRGKGSQFTLSVPIASASEQQRQQPSSLKNSGKTKNYRVLLVEDHVDTRQVMSLLLRSFGCEVETASTVKEATELANREKFDLLVCDFGLPDGTGVDVMRHLNQKQPTKGIAITGFGQDEDIRRSREAGFSVHLTKPISLEMLEQAIEQTTN